MGNRGLGNLKECRMRKGFGYLCPCKIISLIIFKIYFQKLSNYQLIIARNSLDNIFFYRFVFLVNNYLNKAFKFSTFSFT